MLPETLQRWLDEATAQLRCRRAVPAVRAELESHLLEQNEAYRQAGDDAETAARRTVESMGDPVLVGGRLDAVHRPRPAWGPLALLCAMVLAGALLRVYRSVYIVYVGETPVWNWAGADFGLLFETMAPMALMVILAMWGDIGAVLKHFGAWCAVWLVLAWLVWRQAVLHGTPIVYDSAVILLYVPLYAVAVYRRRGQRWRGLALSCLGVLPCLLLAWCVRDYAAGILAGLGCLAVFAYAWLQKWWGVGRGAGSLAAAALGGGLWGLVSLWKPGLYQWLVRFWGRRAVDRQALRNLIQILGQDRSIPEAVLASSSVVDPALGYYYRAYTDGWALMKNQPLAYLALKGGLWAGGLALAATAALLVWLWYMCACIKGQLGRLVAVGACALLTAQFALNLLDSVGLGAGLGTALFLGGDTGLLAAQCGLAGLLLSAFRYDAVDAPEPRAKKLRVTLRWE